MRQENYTAEEQARIFGNVTGGALDDLLEQADMGKGLGDVDTHIEEALAQLPEEDFLCAELEELRKFASKLRGQNKAAVLELVAKMADKLQALRNDMEEADSELDKALKFIRGTE